MREPIKAGDQAEVIGGMGGRKSPNLGLVVKVQALRGEHSQWGRMWRCTGADIKQLHESGLYYVTTDSADFAQDWLRKIEPDTPPPQATTTDKALTV